MDINGKCSIVTGGSMGIGKAIAKLLVRRGANVFLIARRKEPLIAAADEMRKGVVTPTQRIGFSCADVTDLAAVREAVRAAEVECGPISVLVNSAGVPLAGYVEKLPISDIEIEIKTNYLGTVYMIKQVLSGMMERREGWVLNISSLTGLKGIFGYTGYSGSKFAVVGFSEALRSELRPYGIKVSVLCPPDVNTERVRTDTREKPIEMVRISKGAKRMEPDAVAEAAVKGLEQGTFIIIPGFSGKMLYFTNRLVPWLIDILLDRTVEKVRKERGI